MKQTVLPSIVLLILQSLSVLSVGMATAETAVAAMRAVKTVENCIVIGVVIGGKMKEYSKAKLEVRGYRDLGLLRRRLMRMGCGWQIRPRR